VWNLGFLQPCLREYVELSIRLEVLVKCPNVLLIERDQAILLPALPMNCRWLIEAVIPFKSVDDRILDRTETGLRHDVKL
jgi:hypothetical protein